MCGLFNGALFGLFSPPSDGKDQISLGGLYEAEDSIVLSVISPVIVMLQTIRGYSGNYRSVRLSDTFNF